ncbi:MAG: DUF2141 domain-containing protein [Alphaproteobacteria bacterium]|nr:DUF2141 domain-containing protein [Alphaproteobacteria bacterium]
MKNIFINRLTSISLPRIILVGICLIGIIFHITGAGFGARVAHAETRPIITPALQLTVLSTKSSGRVYLQIIPTQHAADFPSATSHISMNYLFDSKNPTQILALPDGIYAISAFHDLNDDGELNRNLVGLPTEPYGFSNDARGTFGPAKFADAQFTITADKITHLTINLK